MITRSDGVQQFRKSKIMTQKLNSDGYLQVKLSKDGYSKWVKVHSLVAKHFVNGYFDGAEVNHIDCDRKNNLPKNLEWVTHSDNIKHSIRMGSHISLRDLSGCNNPNYKNNTLHKKYKQNKELAKEKQSRRWHKNGRAKPIKAVFDDGTELQFLYIGECANYLIDSGFFPSRSVNSVRTCIQRAIKVNKKYKDITFIFI